MAATIGEVATIGNFIRQLRTTRRLSLSQLAGRSAVSRRALCYWEANAHAPSLTELEAVITALGASESERTQALSLIGAPRAVRRLRAESAPGHRDDIGPQPSGGDLLRALRHRRGLAVEQVAAALGVSTATVSRWETGRLVPDSERLDSLLTTLGAQAGERAALSEGYRFLAAPLREFALSAPELTERFHAFMQRHTDTPDDRLDHLRFLSFEAQAWPLAARNSAGRHLLAAVCAHQAAFYAASRQAREAGRYAYRALDLLANDSAAEETRLRAAIVAAQAEVYRGTRPAPERGLKLLPSWNGVATLPRFQAWLLADMAEYLALQSDWEAALRLHQEACRVAQRSPDPDDLRYRKMDMAKVALRAGQAERALSLVTLSNHDFPSRRARIELIYAEALLALGERADAHTWMERANADISAYDLAYLQDQASLLARQL